MRGRADMRAAGVCRPARRRAESFPDAVFISACGAVTHQMQEAAPRRGGPFSAAGDARRSP
ncbi:hypothetical protein PSP6_520059 [Paraburkholderia tropica]|nr:hypothetical protein PSP6_520059 [Paraburkholderia tropica]